MRRGQRLRLPVYRPPRGRPWGSALAVDL